MTEPLKFNVTTTGGLTGPLKFHVATTGGSYVAPIEPPAPLSQCQWCGGNTNSMVVWHGHGTGRADAAEVIPRAMCGPCYQVLRKLSEQMKEKIPPMLPAEAAALAGRWAAAIADAEPARVVPAVKIRADRPVKLK